MAMLENIMAVLVDPTRLAALIKCHFGNHAIQLLVPYWPREISETCLQNFREYARHQAANYVLQKVIETPECWYQVKHFANAFLSDKSLWLHKVHETQPAGLTAWKINDKLCTALLSGGPGNVAVGKHEQKVIAALQKLGLKWHDDQQTLRWLKWQDESKSAERQPDHQWQVQAR